MSGQGSGGNVIAAICNFFIPGLGQLVQGRIFAALMFFVTISICYAAVATWILAPLGLVGLVLHLWCIISAARYKAPE